MAPSPANYSLDENSEPSWLPSTSVTSLAIFSITFFLGFPGNGLVIWVIALKMKRTVNTVWFLHLAMADLICCLYLPFSIAQLALRDRWPFGWFLCKVLPSAVIFSMFASVFLLTAISIDRCLLVMKPVWCQNHRTVRFASRVCSGIWILAFLLCCPYFFYREIQEDELGNTKCINNWVMTHEDHKWLEDLGASEMIPTGDPTTYDSVFPGGSLDPHPARTIENATKRNTAAPLGVSNLYRVMTDTDFLMRAVTGALSGMHEFPEFHSSLPPASISQVMDQPAESQPPTSFVSSTMTRTVLGFLLPFTVMAICYALIAWKMLGKHFAGPRKRALWVILLVVATFFLCWAPFHIIGLLFLFAHSQMSFYQALLWWDSVSIALAYANSCVNPLLYVFVGQKFRKKACQTVQEMFEGAFVEPSSVYFQDKSKTTAVDEEMEV